MNDKLLVAVNRVDRVEREMPVAKTPAASPLHTALEGGMDPAAYRLALSGQTISLTNQLDISRKMPAVESCSISPGTPPAVSQSQSIEMRNSATTPPPVEIRLADAKNIEAESAPARQKSLKERFLESMHGLKEQFSGWIESAREACAPLTTGAFSIIGKVSSFLLAPVFKAISYVKEAVSYLSDLVSRAFESESEYEISSLASPIAETIKNPDCYEGPEISAEYELSESSQAEFRSAPEDSWLKELYELPPALEQIAEAVREHQKQKKEESEEQEQRFKAEIREDLQKLLAAHPELAGTQALAMVQTQLLADVLGDDLSRDLVADAHQELLAKKRRA